MELGKLEGIGRHLVIWSLIARYPEWSLLSVHCQRCATARMRVIPSAQACPSHWGRDVTILTRHLLKVACAS
jgi:hypothetical protein